MAIDLLLKARNAIQQLASELGYELADNQADTKSMVTKTLCRITWQLALKNGDHKYFRYDDPPGTACETTDDYSLPLPLPPKQTDEAVFVKGTPEKR